VCSRSKRFSEPKKKKKKEKKKEKKKKEEKEKNADEISRLSPLPDFAVRQCTAHMWQPSLFAIVYLVKIVGITSNYFFP